MCLRQKLNLLVAGLAPCGRGAPIALNAACMFLKRVLRAFSADETALAAVISGAGRAATGAAAGASATGSPIT